MEVFARRVQGSARIYFTGGITAVLMGWREMTIDIDLKAEPEPQNFYPALQSIKEELLVNLELASPDQFLPELPNWRERSLYIYSRGEIHFFHYDPYAQILSKLERFHLKDQKDIQDFLNSGLVSPIRLKELFEVIEPELIRYPSVDAKVLRQRVQSIGA